MQWPWSDWIYSPDLTHVVCVRTFLMPGPFIVLFLCFTCLSSLKVLLLKIFRFQGNFCFYFLNSGHICYIIIETWVWCLWNYIYSLPLTTEIFFLFMKEEFCNGPDKNQEFYTLLILVIVYISVVTLHITHALLTLLNQMLLFIVLQWCILILSIIGIVF